MTEHEGEFIVHHEKLVEYGVVTSTKSSNVKDRLDALRLIEDEEYQLLDIQQLRPQGGTSTKKVYMLTPEAFKTCLMRARKYPRQTIDPAVYSKYYLLLEKIYKLFSDYEKELALQQARREVEEAFHNQLVMKIFQYIYILIRNQYKYLFFDRDTRLYFEKNKITQQYESSTSIYRASRP